MSARSFGQTLRIAVTALALSIGLVVAGAYSAFAAGNDYPYATQASTTAQDPWGFTERQCVSFVAWRAHQSGHDMHNTSATPWGNAEHWDTEATALGKAVNKVAAVGAFAQWNAGERTTWTTGTSSRWFAAGSQGHVAYVAAVYTDGTILLEDYNGFGGYRVYGSARVPASAVPRFLHYVA